MLGCSAGEPGLNWVCAYMIYVAYTQKEEIETTFFAVRAEALSPHVGMHLITAGMITLQERNVTLLHTAGRVWCVAFKEQSVFLSYTPASLACTAALH